MEKVTDVEYMEKWQRQQDELARRGEAALDAELDELVLTLDNSKDTDVENNPSETPKSVAHKGTDALKQKLAQELERVNFARSAPTSFPVTNVEALPIAIDPYGSLEALMEELRQHGDYRRVRDEYCQLSILINLKGAVAPAFRPLPKTGKRKGDSVFFEIHRDQMVIDCHWLYSKRLNVRVANRNPELRPIFQASRPFPFQMAWEFATKNWKKGHRVNDVLSLTPFQQCQLATLRGAVVSERFELALKGKYGRASAKMAAVRQGLSEWCERDRRIISQYENYERLWLAREVLGEKASVRQIAELFALMTGDKQLDDKTIRGKLEKMDRHIGGV